MSIVLVPSTKILRDFLIHVLFSRLSSTMNTTFVIFEAEIKSLAVKSYCQAVNIMRRMNLLLHSFTRVRRKQCAKICDIYVPPSGASTGIIESKWDENLHIHQSVTFKKVLFPQLRSLLD